MSDRRTRREPPQFRTVAVARTEAISPHMTRVVLGGDELGGFSLDRPAASIRLLLATEDTLEIPVWDRNEFLLKDGTRPIIRTLTPRRFDPDAQELSLDVVLHESGIASTWARTAQPGDIVAVSGPGRGYEIDPDGPFLLAGDETAIPAICQLLEHLPDVPIEVHISMTNPDAIVDLHRDVDVSWHLASDATNRDSQLCNAIRDTDLAQGVRIWAAGEAAAMQWIRTYLFKELAFPRPRATVRGYWKRGSDR